MPRSIAAAVVLLVLLLSPAARAADVHGDDERDRYVGTGGLILPGTSEDRTRREVAGCAGCAWRMTSPCVASVLGNPFGSACTSVVRGCPGGELLRTWFRPTGGSWREVGLVCVGEGGPLTVARAGQSARDRVVRGIPALDPALEPPHGVLAQLPVRFRSGQPSGEQAWQMSVLGSTISIVARPTWVWTFGDGGPAVQARDGRIEHVYRRAADFEATCTTTWAAQFTVDGLGPYQVPERISQRAGLTVSVGEGRAILVPG